MNNDTINHLIEYCQAKNVNSVSPDSIGEECLADYKLLGYNEKEHLFWDIEEDKLITIERKNS